MMMLEISILNTNFKFMILMHKWFYFPFYFYNFQMEHSTGITF